MPEPSATCLLLAQLSARSACAEIGENDHAHQRSEQVRERLLAVEDASVENRADRSHDTLGRELRGFALRT